MDTQNLQNLKTAFPEDENNDSLNRLEAVEIMCDTQFSSSRRTISL